MLEVISWIVQFSQRRNSNELNPEAGAILKEIISLFRDFSLKYLESCEETRMNVIAAGVTFCVSFVLE